MVQSKLHKDHEYLNRTSKIVDWYKSHMENCIRVIDRLCSILCRIGNISAITEANKLENGITCKWWCLEVKKVDLQARRDLFAIFYVSYQDDLKDNYLVLSRLYQARDRGGGTVG